MAEALPVHVAQGGELFRCEVAQEWIHAVRLVLAVRYEQLRHRLWAQTGERLQMLDAHEGDRAGKRAHERQRAVGVNARESWAEAR